MDNLWRTPGQGQTSGQVCEEPVRLVTRVEKHLPAPLIRTPLRVTCTGVSLNCPEAQFGEHVFSLNSACPVAPDSVHEDHVICLSSVFPSPQARSRLAGRTAGVPPAQSRAVGSPVAGVAGASVGAADADGDAVAVAGELVGTSDGGVVAASPHPARLTAASRQTRRRRREATEPMPGELTRARRGYSPA